MRVRSTLRTSLPFALLLPVMASCGDAPIGRSERRTRSSFEPLWSAAPDASVVGPLLTTSGEYKSEATVDSDILSDRKTELWAQVYRPTDMTGIYPVIMMLHGNHGTCGTKSEKGKPRLDEGCLYTATGYCCDASHKTSPGCSDSAPDAKFPIPTPNHLGYGYLAERLASWGYVVVSINTNRGITCKNAPLDPVECPSGLIGDPTCKHDFFLNLARGRLVLKHLQKLSEWNQGIEVTPKELGVDLTGKLDFSAVGLMGHSRGGEGVRAAYAQYRHPTKKWVGTATPIPWPSRIPDPLNITAIFEIGAVDGGTSEVLNAEGTPWNQLLPACDGDVSNLEGAKPFERMMRNSVTATTPASYTLVWGANHNFYNTEWQRSDSCGCGPSQKAIFDPSGSGSGKQKENLLHLAMAFFRGNVWSDVPGAYDWSFSTTFDPLYGLHPKIAAVTQIDRAYYEPTQAVLDDMATMKSAMTGDVTATYEDLPEYPEDKKDEKRKRRIRAAAITWGAKKKCSDVAPCTFETEWSPKDMSHDFSLDFRISRQESHLNSPSAATTFSLQLVHGDGTLSDCLRLNDYAKLTGPPSARTCKPSDLLSCFVLSCLVKPTISHTTLQTVRIPTGDFPGAKYNNVRGIRLTFDSSSQGAIYLANIRRTTSEALFMATETSIEPSDGRQWSTEAMATRPPCNRHRHVIPAINTVRAIRALRSPATGRGWYGLEFEVESSVPFPPRADIYVLRAGEIEGYESDCDGAYRRAGFNRICFRIGAAPARGLRGGEPLSVQYGRGCQSDGWDFGQLDLRMIDR